MLYRHCDTVLLNFSQLLTVTFIIFSIYLFTLNFELYCKLLLLFNYFYFKVACTFNMYQSVIWLICVK